MFISPQDITCVPEDYLANKMDARIKSSSIKQLITLMPCTTSNLTSFEDVVPGQIALRISYISEIIAALKLTRKVIAAL